MMAKNEFQQKKNIRSEELWGLIPLFWTSCDVCPMLFIKLSWHCFVDGIYRYRAIVFLMPTLENLYLVKTISFSAEEFLFDFTTAETMQYLSR